MSLLNTLTTNPEYLTITSSSNAWGGGTYDNTNVCHGDVRFIDGEFYTFLSGSWTRVESYLGVGLTTKTISILEWAEKKIKDEQELQLLIEKYPALKQAKEKFDLIHVLVKEIE